MEQTLDNSFIYFINLARVSSYELSAISASDIGYLLLSNIKNNYRDFFSWLLDEQLVARVSFILVTSTCERLSRRYGNVLK